ncbi:MAG TPA: ABC transporter permease [Devosia sp.]|nr:ABC transporter permease [Devosia sp.]
MNGDPAPRLRRPRSCGLVCMLVRRTLAGLVVLWAISALIFAGTQILPGDVATAMLGQQATPEAVAAIRKQLDLEAPPVMRYVSWLGGVLHGDLGQSTSNRQDIAASIAPRLSNTLMLAGLAAAISVPLALLLGAISARFAGSPADRTINVVTLGAISLPEFFAGYLLIAYFSVTLGWFPSGSTVSANMDLLSRLSAMALPTATLVIAVLGHMMRMTRAALLSVMSAPYIETAELKGLSPWRVIWKHALPNALSPIINVVALNMAYLVVGVVVVEVIFVYPGMGQYMVDHVAKRDVPVVQACGLIFAAVYILLNLIADLASVIANPRLRHPR